MSARLVPGHDPDGRGPDTDTCPDCALWVQGGAWGWAAHRFRLHGEGEDPGDPPAVAPTPPYGLWTPAQYAAARQRRVAAARAARRKPGTSGGALVSRPGPGGQAADVVPSYAMRRSSCRHRVCQKLADCAWRNL